MGGYAAWWKIIPVIIVLILWGRLVTWIDKDCQTVLLPRVPLDVGMLLGGLLGSVLGGVGRAVGNQTASSGMAFATTWALGQLAKQYYGGGRTLDPAKLKAAFAPLLEQGQGLIGRYGGEIAERARTIDVRKLPALLR